MAVINETMEYGGPSNWETYETTKKEYEKNKTYYENAAQNLTATEADKQSNKEVSPEVQKLVSKIRSYQRWLYAYNSNPTNFRVSHADETYFTPWYGFSYIRAKQLWDLWNEAAPGIAKDGYARQFESYVNNKSGSKGTLINGGVALSNDALDTYTRLIYPQAKIAEQAVDAYKAKLDSELPTLEAQYKQQVGEDIKKNWGDTANAVMTNAQAQYSQQRVDREKAIAAARTGRMQERLSKNPYNIL